MTDLAMTWLLKHNEIIFFLHVKLFQICYKGKFVQFLGFYETIEQ